MADAKQGALRGPNESWFGSPIQGPGGRIAKPTSEAEVIDILTQGDQFPSPVRPVGSRHSMTECISAKAVGDSTRWGTLVDMTGLTTLRDGTGGEGKDSLKVIPRPDGKEGRVTVPAGRTFISVARELQEKNWVFRVNTELGTLTMGAAACGATKDSSFPGEFGQVCADVVGMRIVKPDGVPHDFIEGISTEDDRKLGALRCSYGLFGIVTEVTFRVYPLEPISLEHDKVKPASEKFTAAELRGFFKDWLRSSGRREDTAVFLYLFPFRDRIVAELRRKPATAGELEEKSVRLQARNFFWEKGSHDWNDLAKMMPIDAVKRRLFDIFDKLLAESLDKVLRLSRVNPVAQIVDFDKDDPDHRFTFSMWAFPEADFPDILPQYLELCEEHEATYRSCLPHVSYHIAQDERSLLSYSRAGPVWTLDPICPEGEEGWKPFLEKFNDFCSEKGGIPLLNQTPFLERRHVVRAFGADLLGEFDAMRRQFDPTNRMLNDYFAKLLAP
jgi:FAD/FMN-containing dehydrogenase